MSLTIDLEEADELRVTENVVEPRPPGTVEFLVEGRATIGEEVLGAVAGAALTPERVDVGVGESRTVSIDLQEEGALHLERVEVGFVTPDAADRPPGVDALQSAAADVAEGNLADAADVRPDVLAFTVEGVVRDVAADDLERLATDEAAPLIERVVYAVDDPVRGDGGSGPVLELVLFGYGIVVHRDGTVVVGTSAGPDALGLG